MAEQSAVAQHLVRAARLFERQPMRDQGLDPAILSRSSAKTIRVRGKLTLGFVDTTPAKQVDYEVSRHRWRRQTFAHKCPAPSATPGEPRFPSSLDEGATMQSQCGLSRLSRIIALRLSLAKAGWAKCGGRRIRSSGVMWRSKFCRRRSLRMPTGWRASRARRRFWRH